MRLFAVAASMAALALAGCVPTTDGDERPAWAYYDECGQTTSSFNQMIACGKRVRNETCQKQQSCSSHGDSLVQYGDALAASVRSKELSEPEARRKWIEFKTMMAAQRSQQMMQRETIRAASAPRTCIASGTIVNCF
jgi:hypothetical protein